MECRKCHVTLWALALVAQVIGTSLDPASCHWREMELCMVSGGSFFQNSKGIPTQPAEMERQCEMLAETNECLFKFGERCLTGPQLRMLGMLSEGFMSLERDLCRSDSDLRQSYMKHAPCLHEFQRRHQLECLLQFQVAFEPIHKLNSTLRIPLACCNVKRLRNCFFSNLERECGPEAVGFMDAMVERGAGSRFQLWCRGFDHESQQCQALLPSVKAKPHHGLNTSAISRVISTFTRAQMVP